MQDLGEGEHTKKTQLDEHMDLGSPRIPETLEEEVHGGLCLGLDYRSVRLSRETTPTSIWRCGKTQYGIRGCMMMYWRMMNTSRGRPYVPHNSSYGTRKADA